MGLCLHKAPTSLQPERRYEPREAPFEPGPEYNADAHMANIRVDLIGPDGQGVPLLWSKFTS